MGSINRNSPCQCGSGKKYKKCCFGSSAVVPEVSEVPEVSPVEEPNIWDKPSRGREQDQQIDKLFIQGYASETKEDLSAACEVWGRAWDQLLLRLSPKMTNFSLTLPVYEGSFFLENWIQDYCSAMHNAALSDTAIAKTGASFCQAILWQFTEEDSLFLESFRASLGEFYFLAGEPEQGQKVLGELISDHPQRSIGYAYLSDMLGHSRHNQAGGGPIDLERAIDLLEKALALPVEDAPDYDLELRLKNFISDRD